MAHLEQSAERRQFRRILFDAPVTLEINGHYSDSTLLDISLKGALVKRPPGWQVAEGDPVHVEIVLGDGVTRIDMDARVAHVEQSQIGFACVNIGIESIAHLKRLVELNLADERELHRELRALSATLN